MLTYLIAMLSCFIITLILGKIIIPILHRHKFGQTERDDGPQSHLKKSGTPTMGGIMFIIPITVLSFVFSKGSLEFTLVSVLMMFAYSLIGLIDDDIKIIKKRSLGLKAYQKIIGQFGLAIIFAIYAYNSPFIGSEIYVPFTDKLVDIGIWYIPLVVIAVIAVVNSANLTDGVDGLLSSVSLVVICGISAILFLLTLTGFYEDSAFLAANFSNVINICGIVMGGLIGFLMFNANPAKVFMGDCGAMGIGGIIAAICIIMKMPLLLIICCIIYLLESVSDILQVASFKLTHKRIFKMAPLHHHFELCGMSETQVVAFFTVIQAFFSILAIVAVLPLIK